MSKKPKPLPTDAEGIVELVNSELVSIQRKRLAKLGPDDSGLFAHYEALVQRGYVLSTVDLERIKYIVDELPRFGRYVVYRAGLGELGFALAFAGRQVVAWEPNPARRRAIEEAAARLGPRYRDIRDNFTVSGEAPDGLQLDTSESSLGLGFSLLLAGEGSDEEALTRSVARTDAFLYSPRYFLRNRDEHTAETEARRLLRLAGYAEFEAAPISGAVLALRKREVGNDRQGRLRFAAS